MAADPLGLIGSGGAGGGGLGGVGGAGRAGLRGTPAGGVPTDPNAPSFKDALLENIREVNKLQVEATSAIEDLQTGKRADLEGVLLATQKADTAFRMLLSVHNRVQQAYDEIKQIRV